MFGRLIPDASSWRPSLKFGLIMLGAAFLILALANPQEGSKMVKGERIGSDIAIDIKPVIKIPLPNLEI